MDNALDTKLERMQSILRELESVAVAFSAGVDSTLVLKVALDVLGPENVVAVTGRSDSLARAEYEQAVELAAAVGAEHVVLATDEFQNQNYTSNPSNRCYFCKTTLYEHMDRFIRDHGIRHIVNGTNADDLGDYRPGLQAASEHAVRAPAAEAGLTKADVRELSRHFGLPTFDKPASPCLSSRVPYGQAVTPEKLRMIEAAESVLHALGIRDCRVRHYEGNEAARQRGKVEGTEGNAEGKEATRQPGNKAVGIPPWQGGTEGDRKGSREGGHSARIEVPSDLLPIVTSPAMASRIETQLREIGYAEVIFDPRGLRSGSLNEAILVNISK